MNDIERERIHCTFINVHRPDIQIIFFIQRYAVLVGHERMGDLKMISRCERTNHKKRGVKEREREGANQESQMLTRQDTTGITFNFLM